MKLLAVQKKKKLLNHTGISSQVLEAVLLSSTTGKSRRNHHWQWHLLALWWGASNLETPHQPAILAINIMAKFCYLAIFPGAWGWISVLALRVSVLLPHRMGITDPGLQRGLRNSWFFLLTTFLPCQMCTEKRHNNGPKYNSHFVMESKFLQWEIGRFNSSYLKGLRFPPLFLNLV